MATRGIDIRQTADRIIFRASLKDSAGDKVTTGTTELRVYRLEDDGTLDVLDWDAGVKDFVASGAADDEVAMTHRQADGVDTGIWTYVLSDATLLASFDSGQVYIAQVTNAGAVPESQEREFQFGGVEGDQASVASGTGPKAITITVTDGTDPLSGASVSVYLNGLLKATGTTNGSGQFIANVAASGVHSVVAKTDGHYQGSAVTFDAASASTATVALTAIVITPSANPATTTLFGTVLDANGDPQSGVVVTCKMLKKPAGSGKLYSPAILTDTSGVDGVVEFDVPKGGHYEVSRANGLASVFQTIAADAGTTTELDSVL